MAVDIIIDPLTGQIYWNDSQSTAQSIAISGNGSDLIKVVGYSLGYTAAPSGTITTGAATTAVTGSGTAFTTQLAQGAILYTAQGTSIGTVSTITNDTSLSLTTNASASYTAISFRITPSTGTDRLVFSDSATPIYPATTGANLGTSSYRWSLYASSGDFTNASTTTPNIVIDKSGIGSTESAGLQFINTSLATSGGQFQFPSWLEFRGKVWNTTVTAASNDARMRIGMAVNPGLKPETEFVIASSIDTGTASWYYPFSINSTTNDSIAYFNNSLVSIGKLLTLGTTSSYALELYNYSLATSGETVHYSPGFDQNASAWNTSTATSNIVRFRSEVQPTSGASVAGTLVWKSAVATSYSATPTFTDRFKIGSDGTVTIPGSLTLGSASGALYASTGAVSVGTLPVASGGTGTTSYANNNGLIYFDNGNSRLTSLATGATTTVLVGGGASAPSFAQVNLTNMVTGTLPLGNGGLGTTTFTQNGVLYGNAATSILATAAGTNGQLFLGVTSAAPQWGTMSGDASIGNTGVVTIANTAVTFAKIQNSAAAGLSVIGRSTNSAGSFAEIATTTDGAILRLSGTTLGFGAINLATTNAVTGILAVGNGGTGTSTAPTQWGVIFATSTSQYASTGAGSTDAPLLARTGAAPAFAALPLGSSNAVTGTLSITNGGTGSTTATSAINTLLPTQTGNGGKYLTTDGTSASWGTVAASPGGSSGQIQFNNSSSFGGAAALVYSSATTTAHLTITSQAVGNTPLLLKGIASQSANLFDVQNSSGTSLISIVAVSSGSSAKFQIQGTSSNQDDILSISNGGSMTIAGGYAGQRGLRTGFRTNGNNTADRYFWSIGRGYDGFGYFGFGCDESTGVGFNVNSATEGFPLSAKFIEDSTTNTVKDVLNIERSTSGTAAAGIGARISYRQEHAGGTVVNTIGLDGILSDAGSTTYVGALSVKTNDAGTTTLTERARFDNNAFSLYPLGASAGNTYELRFMELAANGSNYIAFKGPDSVATNYTYVWPNGAPSAGQLLSASAPVSGVVTLSWATDQLGTSGGGITSLNGLSAASQSFANDTNVTISSVTSTHTLGWTGTLAVGRGGTGTSTAPTQYGVTYGLSTTALAYTAAGSTDQVLKSGGGSGAPTWGAVNLSSTNAISGTLPIASGGTGSTTAANAINALLPSQTSNGGKYLTTDGTSASWATVVSGGSGTVSSGTANQIAYYSGATTTASAASMVYSAATTTSHLTITAQAVGNNPLKLVGTTSQTADLFTVATSGGTVFNISSTGVINSGTWNGTTLAVGFGGTGTSTAPTQWGVIFATSTSQYASTGAGSTDAPLLARTSGAPAFAALPLGSSNAVTGTLGVGNGGTGTSSFTINTILTSGATTTGAITTATALGYSASNQHLTITAQGAATSPLRLVGATSQTADLFQIYSTSAGTVLGSVGAFGGATFTSLATSATTPATALVVTGAAHTALNAATEYSDVYFNLGQTKTFATGGITTLRTFRIAPATYAFSGASAVTNAATFQIDGAPTAGTNATLTEAAALRILTGTASGKGLVIRGTTSQTGNYIDVQNNSGTSLVTLGTTNINLGPHGTTAGNTFELRFSELAATGSEYIAFKAPDSITTSYTYVWPNGAPSSGQLLSASAPSTTGVVTLSWATDQLGTSGGGITSLNSATGASQSFSNDTNVTITTNTGTNTHALGWLGNLAIGRGGIGTTSLTTSNAIVYYDGSNSKLATLGTGATTTVLVGGGASAPSFAQVDLTTMVTGTLPLTRGGLGTTTFTQNGVLYGNAGTSILVTAAGTNGQLFLGVTSGAPQWGTMSGDASIGNTGVITIANSAVTYAKIQSSVSGNTVLGRSAATGGAFAEIAASSDGSILRLSGTALGFGSINLASSNAVGSSILPIGNGGTGSTTAANAINALLPTQTGNGGKYLTTDGTSASWGTVGGSGTVGSGTANQLAYYSGATTTASAAAMVYSTATTTSHLTITAQAVGNNPLKLVGATSQTADLFTVATSGGTVFNISSTGIINSGTWNGTTIAVGYGGTGTSTAPTQWGVIFATSTSQYASTGAGSTDAPLLARTGAAPAFAALPLGSSNAVTGILGLTNGGTATSSFATTNGLIYYTGSALATLATTASGVLVTNGSGVPSVSTDIPTAVTIGGAYNYRAGGTDVALADGGTGQSTYTNGDILYYNSTSSTTALTKLGIAATSGYFLTSTGSAPQWSQTLGLTNGGTGLTAAGTGNYILGMNSGGSALEYKQLVNGSNITITHGAGTITIASSGGVGSSAVPGGADTNVQYNSGGTTFAGTSYFAYNYTSALLTLTASSSIQTTSTAALELANNSAASTSVANHYSPALDFAGKYWSAGNTYYAKFREEVQTTAATPTHALVWKSSGTTSTTPAFTNRMALDVTKGLGFYAYTGSSIGTSASFFKAGSQTSDFNYTLPITAPTANQVLSVSAVAGSEYTLSWATPGSGSGTVSSGTASQMAYYSGTTTTASAAGLVYSATGTHLTITAQGASTSPLKVVGAASQSASIFTVSTSGGDVLTVDSSGFTSITGLSDTGVTFQNSTTTSKKFKFDAASISAATTRTITIPDATTTMVGTDATQTLTNKTISGFVVNTSASVAAAGTTQGTATAITADYVVVTSATAGSATGVILPTAVAGREVMVVNRASTPIRVYPATGASIDGAAANAATEVGVNQFHVFKASSATAWFMLAPHRPLYLTFCAGYTPATTGADSVVLRIPDSSADGSTVLNYTVRELFARVETPSAGTSTIQVEYYTGTGAFSATNLMSTALSVTGASTYEFTSTAFSTTTLTSGTKLRLNFTALNTTHANFYVQLLLEEA